MQARQLQAQVAPFNSSYLDDRQPKSNGEWGWGDFPLVHDLLGTTEPGQLSDPIRGVGMHQIPTLRRVVVPTENPEGAQCVPAACAPDSSLHLQGNMFAMKQVERPAPVPMAALD
jgi:hypothetical protein